MSKSMIEAGKNLRILIIEAIGKAVSAQLLPGSPVDSFLIEVPANLSHGDFASNVAMIGAKAFRMPPIKIAEIISNNIELNGTEFERCEVAAPGFINFFLNRDFKSSIIKEILLKNDEYGKSNFGNDKRINVEFVSANPTGPMHMGNARGGALGDCLSAVLETAGYNVTREFYINDYGNQIERFAVSLDARYRQIYDETIKMPEDGYQGEDIAELAREFANIHGDSYLNIDEAKRKKDLVDFALPINIKNMKKTLSRYRIDYDVWFKESDLHESGEALKAVELLKEKGKTYEKEGALWYKSSDENEKDEVLIRNNGIPTYFAVDIAYHLNKFKSRDFEKCIDIWGADHHGHVKRLKNALGDLGVDPAKLDIVLMQLVRLVRDGQVVKMSKRTGKALQLEDLMDEVNVDSARFLFNMRESKSQMDFDLDLAVKQDSENPVYYVQYAHARICSIIKKLEEAGITLNKCSTEELNLLNKPEEIELMHHLGLYTGEIIKSASSYDPTNVTKYVISLANLFHRYYSACRVQCEDKNLMQARLALCASTKIVIRNVLEMFKISYPEKM